MHSASLKPTPDAVAVLTKAVWRASRILRLSQSDLAAVLGVSRS
ncbi:transcriptional regulator, XRE family protein, partial [Escherichia coli]|nr:transcriptional regulator, XRE family protein [Escherichia coli]